MMRGSIVGLLVCLVAMQAVAQAPRPNIVVILTDDMGFSDLGCYGGEINTPNLDALAAGGLRFTHFYNTGRCCPTRASLLTGLYPHQAAVGHMMEDKKLAGYTGDLSLSTVTIPEALKGAGYSSYMVGKWHVTRHMSPEGPKHSWPLQRGFERLYGTIQGGGNYFDPSALTRDNTMLTRFSDTQYKPERYYYTDALSDHAVQFVNDHKKQKPDQPFFMYVAYTAAHWPMHALEEDIAKYKGKYDAGYDAIRQKRIERLKALGVVGAGWKPSPTVGDWSTVQNREWEIRCMEVYAAMVDRMDRGVGQLVAALRANGQLDNTLILYMQDNGGCQEDVGRRGNMTRPAKPTLPPLPLDQIQTGSRPAQTREGVPTLTGPGVMPGPGDTFIAYGLNWANVSNTPFREYKHFVHEGGISTPLIAHWPKGIKRAGEMDHTPSHLIDVMATALEVSGAKYPEQREGKAVPAVEGKSLAPAFEGKAVEREALYWEHEGNRAVRIGKWKLVAKGPRGKWELYDMGADRSEMNDLAAREPERVKEMVGKWEGWAKRAGAVPWPWKPQYGQVATDQKVFELKRGDNLVDADAPDIEGKGLTIRASITIEGDGVIVAQGGNRHGVALYVREGKLEFALRRDGEIVAVTAPDAMAREKIEVSAVLAKDGAMTLNVGGKMVATGKSPGLVLENPAEGLTVGRDPAGAVGRYQTPNRLAGTIHSAKLELE